MSGYTINLLMLLVIFVQAPAQTDPPGTQGAGVSVEVPDTLSPAAVTVSSEVPDTLSPADTTVPAGVPDTLAPSRTILSGSVPGTRIPETAAGSPAETAVKSTPVNRGLRLGMNLVRPLLSIPEPSGFGMEAVADINFGENYFAVAEGGFSFRDLDKPGYRLREEGVFLRAGADNNFYGEFDDVIALGARIGISAYERSAPFVNVEPDYWGEYSGQLNKEFFIRQWAEVVIVLKTEIFRNVFLGWNIRGKLLLFDKGDENVNERYIPGFGTGTTKSVAGFDFYLYYRFPFRK